MSQNWQQPPQYSGGYPPQQQYGYPPQQPFYGDQPAVRAGRPGLAFLSALALAAICGIAYAYALSSMSDPDQGHIVRITYVGIVVGVLIGAAVGRRGGPNAALWLIGAVLALASVGFGELYGYALFFADVSHHAGVGNSSANDIFCHHFHDLWRAWKDDVKTWQYVCAGAAPVAALGAAASVSRRW